MLNSDKRLRQHLPKLPSKISDPMAVFLLDFLTWGETVQKDNIFDYDAKKTPIQKEFKNQFQTHSKFWLNPLIVIILIFLVDSSLGRNNVQLYGLLFDIVGTALLVASIIRGTGGIARDTREKAGRVGSGGGGGNIHPASLRATTANTINGVAGATFLILGFTIQSYAVVVNQYIILF